MCFNRRKTPKHLIIKDDYHSDNHLGFGWIIFAIFILVAGMFISIAVNAEEETLRQLTSSVLQTEAPLFAEITCNRITCNQVT